MFATRSLMSGGAFLVTVCLLLAGSALLASAQGNNAPTTKAPRHIEIVPPPADEMQDYSLLNNGTFTDFDIQRAKAYRLSDWETAVVLKIAQRSQMSYGQVLNMLFSGKNLVTIAADLGVNWNDLRDVQKQEDEITSYQSAYVSSGINSLRKPYVVPGIPRSAM